jgi:cysteine dioxygenase type I
VTMTEPGVGSRRREEADPLGVVAPTGRSPGDLVDVLRAVAAEPERWRPRVHHQVSRRHYERVVTADDHEVWLICWDVGQMTLLHDHGSSAGAFLVVDGLLLEDYGRAGSGRLRQRLVRRDRPHAFGPSYVHNLANPGPRLATSLHAYSPRLTTMAYYAVLPGGAVPVRTMPVQHPEPTAS